MPFLYNKNLHSLNRWCIIVLIDYGFRKDFYMIPNLKDLRKEIDDIDEQITSLFEKRMAIAEQVALFKIENKKPVFDRNRELEKLQSVSEKAHSNFNRCGIQELYQQIMSISRKRQYQLLQEHGIFQKNLFTPVEKLEKENVSVVFQGV